MRKFQPLSLSLSLFPLSSLSLSPSPSSSPLRHCRRILFMPLYIASLAAALRERAFRRTSPLLSALRPSLSELNRALTCRHPWPGRRRTRALRKNRTQGARAAAEGTRWKQTARFEKSRRGLFPFFSLSSRSFPSSAPLLLCSSVSPFAMLSSARARLLRFVPLARPSFVGCFPCIILPLSLSPLALSPSPSSSMSTPPPPVDRSGSQVTIGSASAASLVPPIQPHVSPLNVRSAAKPREMELRGFLFFFVFSLA